MTLERNFIRLIDNSKAEVDGSLSYDDDAPVPNDGYKLTLDYDGHEITGTDGSYFHALCRIREELERRGLRPVCYGSSHNVYPSAMSCQMGGGIQAYRMTLGQPATMKDLVDIFETGPDVDPATVDEQEQYRDQWFESLKSGKSSKRSNSSFFAQLRASLAWFVKELRTPDRPE